MASHTEVLTTGRNGITIPEFYIDKERSAPRQIGQFFHRLWQVNGFNNYEYARGERQPYLHELVVPAEADKPLVVVRGQYTTTSSRQRQNNRDSNARYNRLDNSGGFGQIDESVVTVGTEEHSVLLPPASGSLAWLTLLSYRHQHQGGSHLIDSSQMPEPTIRFMGQEQLWERAVGPDRSNDFDTRSSIYAEGIQKVLANIVELVSIPR